LTNIQQKSGNVCIGPLATMSLAYEN